MQNCSTWVFSVPCAYIVSVYLPMKVKHSFITKNELFNETVFLKVLFYIGTELQMLGFVIMVRACSNFSL